jgi:hypothetical protein
MLTGRGKSPFLTEDAAPEFDTGIAKGIIEDCKTSGVELLRLCGEGEPTLHSSFVELHEHAIKAGEKVRLPRHQKRFKEFVRLDNKFHHELEVMLKAAKKNKIVAVKRQAQRLLDACVRCHNVFRK